MEPHNAGGQWGGDAPIGSGGGGGGSSSSSSSDDDLDDSDDGKGQEDDISGDGASDNDAARHLTVALDNGLPCGLHTQVPPPPGCFRQPRAFAGGKLAVLHGAVQDPLRPAPHDPARDGTRDRQPDDRARPGV